MNKFARVVCVLLILAMVLPMTVMAAENVDPRASEFFMSDSCYLHKTSGTEFEVWFDVAGLRIMDEIGARTVKVQRSTDGESWTDMKTFRMADYPEMIGKGTAGHSCGLSYAATTGYYYRAYVVFYAKIGTSTATLGRYTSKLKM